MNEKLRKTAETLWQDEMDFLRILPVLGVKEVIKSLRSPLNLPSEGIGTETIYPTAA